MKCPHCTEGIFEDWKPASGRTQDRDAWWQIYQMTCPQCLRLILELRQTTENMGPLSSYPVRPRNVTRPLSSDIPEPYSSDFREAASVLADSPKASAALSRRSLQMLLRDKGNVKPSDLSKEIDEAMPGLPAHLADSIDAIRNIGNFAAHPNKSTNTAEVIDVEPGEAEWCLDVLEGLFDFYFVQPALTQRRKAALNEKLTEAGKPPMK